MELLTEGDWWLKSKSDPRWNSHGRGLVGGFVIPDNCKKKLEELEKELGNPPPDLRWNYMKD